MADQFKHLKTPILKSISDFRDKNVQANLALRIYLRIAKLFVNLFDQPTPDETMLAFSAIVRKSEAFGAFVAKEYYYNVVQCTVLGLPCPL